MTQVEAAVRSAIETPLLDRHHALIAALIERPTGRKALSKTALKVYAIMVEHADDSGLAFPALETLAALAKVTNPQASASIMELRAKGYLGVAEAGTRTRSTRHRMTYKGMTEFRRDRDSWREQRRAAAANTYQQVLPNLGVPVLPNLETGTPESGNTVLPNSGDKPPTESPRKGRDEVEGLGENGPGPGGPSRSARPLQNFEALCEAFWAVYPNGQNQAAAEQALKARLDDGVAFEDIMAGARRYADFCRWRFPDGQYVKYATTFLDGKKRHWRDKWPEPKPKVEPPSAGSKAKPGKKAKQRVEASKARSAAAPGNASAKPAAKSRHDSKGSTQHTQAKAVAGAVTRRPVVDDREAAWQKVGDAEWRARVEKVRPEVDICRTKLGLVDGKGGEVVAQRIREAIEIHAKDSDGRSASDLSVQVAVANFVSITNALTEGSRPSAAAMYEFEERHFIVRVAKHFAGSAGVDREREKTATQELLKLLVAFQPELSLGEKLRHFVRRVFAVRPADAIAVSEFVSVDDALRVAEKMPGGRWFASDNYQWIGLLIVFAKEHVEAVQVRSRPPGPFLPNPPANPFHAKPAPNPFLFTAPAGPFQAPPPPSSAFNGVTHES